MTDPKSEGFAGLPAASAAPQRPAWRYTIPPELVPPWWDRDDQDRSFEMIAMSPDEQDRAVKASGGGQNVQAAGHQMIVRSIYRVGENVLVNKYDAVNKWLKDIGPKGYRLVQAAWVELHSVEDGDVQAFLEKGQFTG